MFSTTFREWLALGASMLIVVSFLCHWVISY